MVIDELQAKSWKSVQSVGIGGDQTSIYVVMSRTFQAGQLQPWVDLSDEVQTLDDYEWLKFEQRF
ncbi:hypothetical protein [Moorena sp. SIOASIH]|uniref:hypothetical protein n=1 Tax=Moorena sp. SIOASIH TaxID=2607817 RepID=UPI0025D5D16A|nr:hypothetical protein [Moorena sp. SIOASIH]